MIGLTAGESRNPARDVPKAVRFVFWRVLVIFLGGIFFLSLTVPWNDPTLLHGKSKTARSPFVIAFINAGLPRGADAINAIIVSLDISSLRFLINYHRSSPSFPLSTALSMYRHAALQPWRMKGKHRESWGKSTSAGCHGSHWRFATASASCPFSTSLRVQEWCTRGL